ncbi:MAG TPA: tetratricopeptide repeat protein, partial [Roseiflexaceae bacterium]|nr:tetratricopeptide repeat protein [Roseiflexaceae bacterium]
GVAEAHPLGLGVLYLRRGMPSMAVAELERAVERYPRRADLRAHYAEALRRSGQPAEARRQLEQLAPAAAQGLPALLLRTALAPPSDAPALRARCARHDPDGVLARRFFAPESPPWELPPAPALPWSEDLEPLEPYLGLVAADRSLQLAACRAGSTPAPAAPASSAKRAPTADHVATSDEAQYEDNPQASRFTLQSPVEPDPDVKSFISTAERLRRQLAIIGGGPRPLAPWASSGALTQVILSSRAALLRRFGEDGFRAVDERLRALAEALRRRGVPSHVCYCDDPASLEPVAGAQLPPTPQDPAALRELVGALAGGLAARGSELGVLLIVGGDEIVPFHRLPNPIPDDDPLVLSDNPYASGNAGHLVPQRIVARIPEGAAADPGLLLAILDAMLAHHSARPPRGRLLLPLRSRRPAPLAETAAGYCAEVWRATSRAALDALTQDAPLHICPPLDATQLDERALAGGRVLYANLHGAQGLPNFYGQPDAPWSGPAERLPIALRPDQLAGGMLAGGMLLTEACYGAELAGRTPANSIPLRALASGALACVGATVNAYGSAQAPLVAADLLFQRMLAHLERGAPLGEALHHARHEFAQEMYRRQGYLDDVDSKTLIEFVLLGDPWVALEGAGDGGERPAWPAARVSGIEHVPRPRPKVVLAERDIPGELVRRAREALRRALPGGGAAPLLITAQPNPRRQRKGEAEQDLVFSARETRPTADGYYVTQAAHVTLSGRAVVKMVQTR